MKTFFLTLFALLLQACSTSSETHIKQAELLSLLQSEQTPVIIDGFYLIEFSFLNIIHST